MQRAFGKGGLSTYQRTGGTHLSTLYQEGCAKIRLPNTHSQTLEAVLINTAGGLTGGDLMQWSADLAPEGRMVLTTQACERIYRSLGGPARVETRMQIGENAHLDWLPQETILFAASELDRRLDIDLATGASLTAVEAILLGRDAMGEAALDAKIRDNWRIRRNGRLIHAEATRLDGTLSERNGLSLLAGKRAFGTILHIAPDADQARAALDRIRALLPADPRIAASANGERLVIRALAQTGLALRRLIVPILSELSVTGTLPRMWHL
ncbi:MAG: urease accessory protein UreD [Candidatus Devosia phytovorans]|uniref:Urease accessory protein UreD n=1 Tax=Candidatus Devosia phytovorans TaxID=3121372 RepID=A0AAJ6B1G7_9HYPH|nr:urease accessory protein UreD [Devosia sp.]WEK05334.1 MAG: urease accessory protein UreD [Devosia sp.]